jgi:hypothetical protein
MNIKISGIVARIAEMEQELEREIELEAQEMAQEFHYTLEKKKITFDEATRLFQKTMRQGILAYLRDTPLKSLLVAPIIYSLYLPLILLDFWIWLYQSACFRAYGIPRVDRSLYVTLDRGHLPYLNWIEQANCNYCGYANGLIAYAREVAARTEQYFCPIKHARKVRGTHSRYQSFFNFGDAEGYKAGYEKVREELKE